MHANKKYYLATQHTYCRCKKKNKYYKVISESETTAEDEDQLSESDHTETQDEIQQIICVHPTSSRSLSAEGDDTTTVLAEFEMQKVQQ